jgi:hypothetical protein
MIKKEYSFGMFILCFLIWGFVVDQAVLPGNKDMRQNTGTYTRYRVRKLSQGGKLGFLEDQLMIYAVVKNRERIYYMEYMPGFESALKRLPKGTPISILWARRFPKVWKNHIYEIQESRRPILRYSSFHLQEKQAEIWKFTGVIGGVFLILMVLGLINKPAK